MKWNNFTGCRWCQDSIFCLISAKSKYYKDKNAKSYNRREISYGWRFTGVATLSSKILAILFDQCPRVGKNSRISRLLLCRAHGGKLPVVSMTINKSRLGSEIIFNLEKLPKNYGGGTVKDNGCYRFWYYVIENSQKSDKCYFFFSLFFVFCTHAITSLVSVFLFIYILF